MEAVKSIVEALNSITPLGLAAGLAYIIYQLAGRKGRLRNISENHLSGLPELEQNVTNLLAAMLRLEQTMGEVRDGINFLKGRINGR